MHDSGAHTVAYMYLHAHLHTLMQVQFMHTNFTGRYFKKHSFLYLSKNNNLSI